MRPAFLGHLVESFAAACGGTPLSPQPAAEVLVSPHIAAEVFVSPQLAAVV
jgi:hypothetical protein